MIPMRTLASRVRAVRPGAAVVDFRLTGRGLALVVSGSPRRSLVYALLSVITVSSPVAQVWLAKRVVDDLAAASAAGSFDASTALGPALLYAMTLLSLPLVGPLLQTIHTTIEERAIAQVDRALLDAGARIPDLTLIESPAFRDELRLLGQASHRIPSLLHLIQFGVGTAVALTGVLVLVGTLNPVLPVLLLIAAIPHMLVIRQLNQSIWNAMQDHSHAAREMDYAVRVVTDPSSAKEVRVFDLGPFFLDRFHQRYVTAREEVRRIRLRALARSLAAGSFYALSLGGGLWYVADQAGKGNLSLGDIALYTNAVIQVQNLIFGLPILIGGYFEFLPYIRSFFKLIDEAGPAIAVPPAGAGVAAPRPITEGIDLDAVTFSYPQADDSVFTDFTAHVPPGKITAVVGANGAGKTTLVKLLARLYDPGSGGIFLDGRPLDAYDLDDLRRGTSVAFQDAARFAFTLRDNIAVGSASDFDAVSKDALAAAAAWSGADEIAHGLTAGYDTELTRRFEGGIELSGGGWQKVALARSAMRETPLLILDEPNSALDAEAEHRLIAGFRTRAAGRTAIIISHRLSTVRMADHIIVLDGGAVIESGSHAALLALGGRYAELFAMQADRYTDGAGQVSQ